MKRVMVYTFFLSFSALAKEVKVQCPLTESAKRELIETSPHWVDEVRCNEDMTFQWIISNKRAMAGEVNRDLASDLESPEWDLPQEKPSIFLKKYEKGIFDLGLGLGGRYYSHKQSGEFVNANVGALFLNRIAFFASYQKENFRIQMDAETYKFTFTANDTETSKRLYGYSLKTFYKGYFIGAQLEQQPIFNKSDETIQIADELSILPTIGYQWNIDLSSTIETTLTVLASASYLMSSSSSDPNVKISGQKGLGGDIRTTLARRLNSNARFPLYYYWSNDVGYRNYERTIQWGDSKGRVKTSHINATSSIGIKLEF